jgi:hypothetical protein
VPRSCAWCGTRVPAGRKCCSPACDAAWLANHVWPDARRYALATGRYVCALCGISAWETTLDVHHREPVPPVVGYKPGCQHHQENLLVLCRSCHESEHRAARAAIGEQLRMRVA